MRRDRQYTHPTNRFQSMENPKGSGHGFSRSGSNTAPLHNRQHTRGIIWTEGQEEDEQYKYGRSEI